MGMVGMIARAKTMYIIIYKAKKREEKEREKRRKGDCNNLHSNLLMLLEQSMTASE